MPHTIPPTRTGSKTPDQVESPVVDHRQTGVNVNTWEHMLENIDAEDLRHVFITPDSVLGTLDSILEVATEVFATDKVRFNNADIYRFMMAIQTIGRLESLIQDKIIVGLDA